MPGVTLGSMFRTYELLFLLFSFSDMMLKVLVKPFIVDTIRKQELRVGKTEPRNIPNTSTARPDTPAFEFQAAPTALTIFNRSRTRIAAILEKPIPEGENKTEGQEVSDGSAVETKAGVYLMIDLAGTHFPWMVFGPACGVWSDRYGRKLPLLIPSLCHVISVVFYMLASYRADKLLLAVVLGSLTCGVAGKNAMFTMAIYSMTSDTTSDSQRTSRFVSLSASRCIGLCLGSLGAGLLEDLIGVRYTMLTSSALQVLTFALIIVVVKETTNQSAPRSDSTSSVPCPGECDDEQTEPLLRTEEGPSRSSGSRRKRMVFVVIIMTMVFLTQSLWTSQTELIVQSITAPQLGWPSSWYGYLSSVYYGIAGLALLLLVPCLVRALPHGADPDTPVLVIALVCGAVCGVWAGLAIEALSTWQVFCAYIFGAVGLAANSPLRSMLSRCVGEESQGKVLAVQSVLENLGKVLGPMLHTAVYVSSLAVSPSLVYYVMAGEIVLLLPVVAWISRTFRRLS